MVHNQTGRKIVNIKSPRHVATNFNGEEFNPGMVGAKHAF